MRSERLCLVGIGVVSPRVAKKRSVKTADDYFLALFLAAFFAPFFFGAAFLAAFLAAFFLATVRPP